MTIAHFDIDDIFAPFFKEKKYRFSLDQYSFKQVRDITKINLITIKSNSKINKQIIQRLPQLKGIIARTVGVDNIDLNYCRKRAIAVYHIPDYGSFAVAEHVFALILAKARRIVALQADIKRGKFHYSKGQGFSLQNKTMGIVGVGRVGKEVANISRGFQLNILGFDVKKDKKFAQKMSLKFVSLNKLLKESDIIVLTIPLNDKTHYLINDSSIKKMKDKSVLINVSRGEIIDTKALLKNIEKFRFVGLDVIEDEDKFNKQNQLLKHSNILITPHIAFFTDRTTVEIAAITNRNIQSFLDGKHTNRIV